MARPLTSNAVNCAAVQMSVSTPSKLLFQELLSHGMKGVNVTGPLSVHSKRRATPLGLIWTATRHVVMLSACGSVGPAKAGSREEIKAQNTVFTWLFGQTPSCFPLACRGKAVCKHVCRSASRPKQSKEPPASEATWEGISSQ
ncbi:unnamed protein product [Polarella glacialis]|uniref:Uncharacterized protein n=1 Tax=Polarella glacialis TaxID=89957 RepID=A0A813FHK4_POLGL|nr:unnamed protein product [Polarella glacialis]CAE8612849.1 unnamed protein product [Polarella glacialis]